MDPPVFPVEVQHRRLEGLGFKLHVAHHLLQGGVAEKRIPDVIPRISEDDPLVTLIGPALKKRIVECGLPILIAGINTQTFEGIGVGPVAVDSDADVLSEPAAARAVKQFDMGRHLPFIPRPVVIRRNPTVGNPLRIG